MHRVVRCRRIVMGDGSKTSLPGSILKNRAGCSTEGMSRAMTQALVVHCHVEMTARHRPEHRTR